MGEKESAQVQEEGNSPKRTSVYRPTSDTVAEKARSEDPDPERTGGGRKNGQATRCGRDIIPGGSHTYTLLQTTPRNARPSTEAEKKKEKGVLGGGGKKRGSRGKGVTSDLSPPGTKQLNAGRSILEGSIHLKEGVTTEK